MVAILYPEVVERLVLACTAVGGEHSVKPSPESMEAFLAFDENDPEGSLRDMLPYLYTHDFIDKNDPEVERFIRYALGKRQNEEGYKAQLAAISSHSSFNDLDKIEAKTLVITGESDRLIPPENSEILAGKISGARLQYLKGAPHRLFAERWEEFNESVLAFLLE
jgi:pimeloyl-ACP methyl ester carboxylesterase